MEELQLWLAGGMEGSGTETAQEVQAPWEGTLLASEATCRAKGSAERRVPGGEGSGFLLPGNGECRGEARARGQVSSWGHAVSAGVQQLGRPGSEARTGCRLTCCVTLTGHGAPRLNMISGCVWEGVSDEMGI